MRLLLLLASILAMAAAKALPPAPPPPANPSAPPVVVALVTSMGRIVLELDAARAPKAVAAFLAYARDGHYNGTIFHRVSRDLLVQGGRYTPDFQAKPERAPVPGEATNGLRNLRGTIAAARRPDDVDSAGSEFFLNVADNPAFDRGEGDSPFTSGYTVFGRVIDGMAVVDAIRSLPVGPGGPFADHVTQPLVVIERVEIRG